MQNQYQRRADLIPNLVATVKGAANFEQETLQRVIEARSCRDLGQGRRQALNNPETFKKFEQAQSQLSSALSRLLVVVEKYPDLKANQNFQNLQAQLEGTENRITVARKRYIESVAEYNTAVRSFPQNLTAKYLLGLERQTHFQRRRGSAKTAAGEILRYGRRALPFLLNAFGTLRHETAASPAFSRHHLFFYSWRWHWLRPSTCRPCAAASTTTPES